MTLICTVGIGSLEARFLEYRTPGGLTERKVHHVGTVGKSLALVPLLSVEWSSVGSRTRSRVFKTIVVVLSCYPAPNCRK